MKTGYQVETTLALSKRHKMEPPFSMPKRKSPECYCTGARAAKRSTTKKKRILQKKTIKKYIRKAYIRTYTRDTTTVLYNDAAKYKNLSYPYSSVVRNRAVQKKRKRREKMASK